MAPIKGISKTSLWSTWKIIRTELRSASIRDVIDFVDYDVAPDVWIQRLLDQISSGRYEPATPLRFTIGKSNGFSRAMTQPAIPDLVLYRTIVDAIYRKALKREHKHVYFKRERLQQAQNVAQQQAVQQMSWAAQYRMTSQRSFYNWLRYAQYRKYLLLQAVHPYLVVTDITNFFDSVLHSHVEEALRGLPVFPRMLGLLFFLLERLSIRQDYASSHGISLPVDEFDCSRTLAHITLFSHDDSMVGLVGEDNYVRWMDDQNLGVRSKAVGLRALSQVGKSLARLHLSPNSKKSQILTLSEARRHFHLDLNGMLDRAEAAAKVAKTRRQRLSLSRQLRQIWSRAQLHKDVGEFDKVLKRIYRLAGFARLRFLRRRALRDILANPTLADRVCDYMRCSGTVLEYLRWADMLMQEEEQIYPDVNVALMESLLRLEGNRFEARQIRSRATAFLSGKSNVPGAAECKTVAPLLILRFGDRRSLPMLRRCFDEDKSVTSAPLLRAAAMVYSSYGDREFREVRRSASRLLRNHLADVVKLVERIRQYPEVPLRYKARLKPRYDSVARMQYVDMRALLTVRLLQLARAPRVITWVADWKTNVFSQSISAYDRRLISRLL
ncbi:MAG: RNA-directed DNA polymerase [Candidatus Korobacteraceae bacterium]